MVDQFIVSPFFLDRELPTLASDAAPGWIINKPTLPEGDVETRMAVYHEELAEAVKTAVSQRKRPVSIQGDCCATIGYMAGLQRAGVDPWYLWLDAHGDFNTHDTTPSGFLGGMPLAMIAGIGNLAMCEAVGLRPFSQNQIILTDGRDLDPEEAELVKNSGVIHMEDVNDLMTFAFSGRPLYVHFDIDILNPLDMNSGNYLAEGGPRAAQLEPIFAHLAETAEITAVSMTTWTPGVGDVEAAKEVSMGLLNVLLGK